uniref:Jupiter microtubule associated homolog 2 n=1 Tax=Podarcis muralis TaxID=64176 RepID=A0A670JJH7_PODMU
MGHKRHGGCLTGPRAAPKPSRLVLQPPGGSSSNLFGSPEEVNSSFRPHRMTSNIFGGAEETPNVSKRTNPPGGKDSGIFEDHKPNPSRHLTNPPGGKTSNIFGSPQPVDIVKAHPNKPKVTKPIFEDQRPQVEDTSEKREPQKKESTKEPGPKMDDHEPRLGPRPRSHNKVLNPPGGKSSIAFY